MHSNVVVAGVTFISIDCC